MRIAYFTDTYMPRKNGIATVVSFLKKELEVRGHTVYLFAPSSQENEKNIFLIPSLKSKNEIEFSYNFTDYPKIKFFLDEFKPDLIHTHTEFFIAVAGRQYARERNVPLVHTSHTLWDFHLHALPRFIPFKKWLFDFLLRIYNDPIQYFTFPSEKSQDVYQSYSRKLRKARIIPNGIDQDRFLSGVSESREELRRKMGYTEDNFVILYTGKVGEEKNFHVLLEHIVPLLKKNPSFRFLIVGQGGLVEEMQMRFKKEKLEDQVQHILRVPWNEMVWYYTVGDVFTTFSLSDVKPLVVIEAVTSGLSCVVIQDKAYKGLVFDGDNGFVLTSLHDFDTFQQKMLVLSKDADLRKRFGEKSKELAQHFTIQNMVNEMESFYKEILEDFELEKQALKLKKKGIAFFTEGKTTFWISELVKSCIKRSYRKELKKNLQKNIQREV